MMTLEPGTCAGFFVFCKNGGTLHLRLIWK